eukprot:scaffold64960_cov17-Tisochrysis_lutea.AAC.5
MYQQHIARGHGVHLLKQVWLSGPCLCGQLTSRKLPSCLQVSAKVGLGIDEVLEAIVKRVPPPKNTVDKPLRALIYDSYYDAYRGVICQFRVVDGSVSCPFRLCMPPSSTPHMMPIEASPVSSGYCSWLGG